MKIYLTQCGITLALVISYALPATAEDAIVVTAERRAQEVDDVALSVTVLGE
ncbi:hypothetical protein MNBD_ALPHA05-1485, partial [hydrothermal vent metagenome]